MRTERPGKHRRRGGIVAASAGLLVAGAVQPWISIDNTSRFLLVGIAFVLLFVWFHTDFTEKAPRAERVAGSRSTRATGADGTGRATSEDIGRGAGRIVGGGVNSLKRWKDSFDSGADDDG